MELWSTILGSVKPLIRLISFNFLRFLHREIQGILATFIIHLHVFK